MQLYGIPHCSTVKNARALLDEQGLAYEFHDFKKGIDGATLQGWIEQAGLDTVLNRRSQTYRKLTASQQEASLDPAQAVLLMQAQPSLIKRPVLVHEGGVIFGLDRTAYAALQGG